MARAERLGDRSRPRRVRRREQKTPEICIQFSCVVRSSNCFASAIVATPIKAIDYFFASLRSKLFFLHFFDLSIFFLSLFFFVRFVFPCFIAYDSFHSKFSYLVPLSCAIAHDTINDIDRYILCVAVAATTTAAAAATLTGSDKKKFINANSQACQCVLAYPHTATTIQFSRAQMLNGKVSLLLCVSIGSCLF